MKWKSVFLISAVTCMAALGCKNNDTTDESSTTTVTDSSATKMDTASAASTTAPAPVMDVPADNTAAKAPGTAKPNPAKKGMKGKVTIAESAPPKSGAKMEADKTGVYSNVEVLPSFPGGNKGLQKFFDDNLEYPADASNDGVEGTVNVSFVVDENGKLTSPKVEGDNLSSTVGSEAWNSRDLKSRPH